MPSATIEHINRIVVATAADGTVILSMHGDEDARVMTDLPRDTACKLTLDLIAAGYGPAALGGKA